MVLQVLLHPQHILRATVNMEHRNKDGIHVSKAAAKLSREFRFLKQLFKPQVQDAGVDRDQVRRSQVRCCSDQARRAAGPGSAGQPVPRVRP